MTLIQFDTGGLVHSRAKVYTAHNIVRWETSCGIAAPAPWWRQVVGARQDITCPSCGRAEDKIARGDVG